MLWRKYYLRKRCLQTYDSIAWNLYVLLINSEEETGLLACEFRYFEQVDFRMCFWVVNTAPLFFSLLLERLLWYVFNERCCNSHEKILLNNFSSSHGLTQHKELSFFLILNILREKDDTKIIDSSFYFGFTILVIEEFVNILHVRYRLFGVSDDNDLVIFCG